LSSRILVIDDETNIRMMIRLTLQHAGYEVETAADGQEGLEKFGKGGAFDLVLLDQRMPGMSGIDVQKEIYKRNPETRLILITAFGTIDLALEAIQAGASDFLRKPFTAATLRQAVKSAIERPVRRMSAVPIGMVCREFTRTTINGYSFELEDPGNHPPEDDDSVTTKFRVSHPNAESSICTVVLPAYVLELAKAYTDSEEVPGGERFWQAMAEEALANYLWQNAAMPPDNHLRIEDLSGSLQRWLDTMMTVELTEENAR
jgi:CheY-like chemotaxis protein